MKNKLLFLVLLFLPLRGTFAQNKPSDATHTTPILLVLNKQVAAWNKGDIPNFMRGYWHSPDLVFVSGSTITKGWQPTLERYQKTYSSQAKMGRLQFTNLKVSALAKDSATVVGNWALTRANDHPHGAFTLKFRKIDNQWYIVRDQTTQF